MLSRVFIILIFIGFAQYAQSATMYRVNASQTTTIDEWGTCQDVTNGSAVDIMVPTNTSAEWLAFRSNLPPSVSLASCAGCSAGATNYTSNSSGITMPSGCNYATFKAWGGGGGAGTGNASAGAGGGSGYATSAVGIAPGETFDILIGTGGQAGACATVPPSGGTGAYAGGTGG